MASRVPVACGEQEAMTYVGLLDRPNLWEELKARKVVKSLRRNWYAFADLDLAIEHLRTERDKMIQVPSRGRSAKKFETPKEFMLG